MVDLVGEHGQGHDGEGVEHPVCVLAP
jgi:hypothetical protein